MSYTTSDDGFHRVNGKVSVWPPHQRQIVFAFDPEFPSRFISACYAAADTLNTALEREFITFTEIRIPYRAAEDGQNVISMGKSTRAHAPNHAAETALFRGRYIYEADIDFDDSHFTFGTSRGAREADVESVCLHELGHALGLGHDEVNRSSVMYPRLTLGRQKRRLAEVDRQRLQQLYPRSAVSLGAR